MDNLRVFHDGNIIIGACTLEGDKWPYSVADMLPRFPGATGCIESDSAREYLASDEHMITDGKLVIGAPRPVKEPLPARDIPNELDALRAGLVAKGILES